MIKPVQRELYAVIGNPVSHSLSPIMMAAAFEALGYPAVYLALEVDSLEEDLSVLAAVGLRGLSVTLPHKVEAFRLASERDETAEAIQAVNTLCRKGGRWQGRNTDWLGATLPLRRLTALEGKNALVLGAGGVARAVVYGLKREGGSVTIANRDEDRGRRLAEVFGCSFIPLEALRAEPTARTFDVVVQCTSVGLMGSGSAPLLPDSYFRAGMVVMDTVYRPAWTDFLQSARAAGCTVVQGFEMLIYQGVAQLEWWLGRSVPPHVVDRMRAAVEGALLHG
ncbi:MAG: shikimate dehydrogenase [Syntrophobacteraceae bacterium]